MNFKLLRFGYIFTIIALFLYSYTQVDLNLTLSQISVWQTIEKFFQNIGWFQRPLSTILYVSILLLLTVFYGLFLWLAEKGKLTIKQFWPLVIISSIILLFSYNAFSYDLFNYMFDARVVTYHHQSPYEYRALDYPSDPWIHFMRWTHRLYPYGPVWLWFTVPLSAIGMQVFLPTLFMFKALAVASFLGTAYFIGKITQLTLSKTQLLSVVFFALNPLVIIEGLVSSHNDIVMMFFAVSSFYFLIKKKYVFSIILLALSIGLKFATALLIPTFLLIWYFNAGQKKINYNYVFLSMTALMLIAVVAASIRTNFQPWYLLYVLPFAAVLPTKPFVVVPAVLGSAIILLEYVPFLYVGNWNPPIPWLLNTITLVAIVLPIILAASYLSWQKKKSSIQ